MLKHPIELSILRTQVLIPSNQCTYAWIVFHCIGTKELKRNEKRPRLPNFEKAFVYEVILFSILCESIFHWFEASGTPQNRNDTLASSKTRTQLGLRSLVGVGVGLNGELMAKYDRKFPLKMAKLRHLKHLQKRMLNGKCPWRSGRNASNSSGFESPWNLHFYYCIFLKWTKTTRSERPENIHFEGVFYPSWVLCDQIGRISKVLGHNIFCKSSQNGQWLFGLNCKNITLKWKLVWLL